MMDQQEARRAQDLLAPFRVDPGEPATESETAALRARLVPALRGALRRAVARRVAARRWRMAGLGVTGMAAAAAVTVFVATRGPRAESSATAGSTLEVFVEGGRVVHRSANGVVSMEAGRPLRIVPDGVLATHDDAHARLAAGGVELGLAERTEIGLEELGEGAMERVRLHGGSLRCVVPPLGAQGRFSVVTPDATVVVHGTVFSVEVSPDLRAVPRTCVVVEDGVVSVRHRSGIARLTAGESWGCLDRDEAVLDLPAERAEPTGSALGNDLGAAAPAPAPPASGPSAPALAAAPRVTRPGPMADLAEQNRLFQGALAAERRGDRAAAAAALEELLRAHPSSPLAPEARTMLARIQSRQRPPER